MAAMGEDQRQTKAPIIETASGTTDPNNAKSGSLPYVITAVTIALLLMLGVALKGLFSLVGNVVEDNWDYLESPYNPYSYNNQYEEYEYYEDPFGLMEEYYNDQDGYTYYDNGQIVEDGMGSPSGTISVTDALGSELGMYQSTIDAALPQSSYANAQESVRTFVRSLVITDRDASSSLASDLHSAAWNEGDVAAALDEAAKAAADTSAALQGLELPQVEGESAEEVKASLEEGKKHAIERWDAVSAELELLASADELDVTALNEADLLVTRAAADAADDFAQAMSDSINR